MASLFVKDRLTKGTMLWDASLTQLKTHSVGSEEVDFRSVNWSNWQSNCRLCVLCECAAPLWRADSVLLHPNCLPTEKSNHSVKKMTPVTLWRGERQRNKILLDGLVDFRPKRNVFLNQTMRTEWSPHDVSVKNGRASSSATISEVWCRPWLGSDRITGTRTSHPGLCRTSRISRLSPAASWCN